MNEPFWIDTTRIRFAIRVMRPNTDLFYYVARDFKRKKKFVHSKPLVDIKSKPGFTEKKKTCTYFLKSSFKQFLTRYYKP